MVQVPSRTKSLISRMRSRFILLAAIAVVFSTGCVASPLNHLEMQSRSTPVPVKFVFSPDDPSGKPDIFLYNFYKQNGAQSGGFCCRRVGPEESIGTDVLGWRWLQSDPGSIVVPNNEWYSNPDWMTHPNARWKARIEFRFQAKTSPSTWAPSVSMFTYEGNADGTFNSQTAACIESNYHQSGGKGATAACARASTIINIYARGD